MKCIFRLKALSLPLSFFPTKPKQPTFFFFLSRIEKLESCVPSMFSNKNMRDWAATFLNSENLLLTGERLFFQFFILSAIFSFRRHFISFNWRISKTQMIQKKEYSFFNSQTDPYPLLSKTFCKTPSHYG